VTKHSKTLASHTTPPELSVHDRPRTQRHWLTVQEPLHALDFASTFIVAKSRKSTTRHKKKIGAFIFHYEVVPSLPLVGTTCEFEDT